MLIESEKKSVNPFLPMLKAMIAVAKSDGMVQSCERERILHLMESFRIRVDDQASVEAWLDTNTQTTLPDMETVPDYDFRRYVFQQALIMAFQDHVLTQGEKEVLALLADLLQLEDHHQAQAWRTARDLASTQ